MPKSFKINKQQRAKEAKSCMKVPSRKMTRLEHARQKTFKSFKNSVNQNCPEFVILNKQEAFKKLDGNVLDKIKDFEKQGFHFVCLKFLLYIFYGIYDLVKN